MLVVQTYRPIDRSHTKKKKKIQRKTKYIHYKICKYIEIQKPKYKLQVTYTIKATKNIAK